MDAVRAERGPNPIALLTSWLVLVAGLTLIGTLVLGPDLDRAELAEARTCVLEQRLDWWERRAGAHEDFLVALRADDPLVLEHLALTELNRIVRGKRLYDERVTFVAPNPAVLGHLGGWLDDAAGPLTTAAISAPRRGYLDGLSSWKRVGLLVAGSLFVVAGILWNPQGDRGVNQST
ncbi:hypothetical protein [Mucisphaera calidilacus]|uniref:Uncharacterized protein n=1 Tax=Mucisphaera calidilacus TaxID=2527982 RepID=A0A518BX81_9BACT|nr:hypothetical protein [Mucisphaera calidilacus]QDU71592.1 hypothetical protein Pan265_14440 [Mucisphaera calidilacus]